MEIRCDSCHAVYEIDETQSIGTMARCSRCGHTFPIRRSRTLPQGMPVRPLAKVAADMFKWQLRSAQTGNITSFEDLATLRQWITERRVMRDDTISRSGKTWHRLAEVPELASLFHELADEPESNAPAPFPSASAIPWMDEAVATNSGKRTTSPELQMGDSARRSEPLPIVPRSRLGPWLLRGLGLGLLLVLLAGGGYFVGSRWETLRGCAGRERTSQAYLEGMQQFLLDSDTNFHIAALLFERARGANETSALPVAALAELNAQWASYLEDDARAARETGRADQLRKDARLRLEDAKRYAGEALTLGTELPEANRAQAAFLLASGGAAPQVEFFLSRAGGSNKAELAFLRGSLALREGKNDEARRLLEEASRLERVANQRELLRAEYLLGRMDVAAGNAASASNHAQRILALNPAHERARALMAVLSAPAAPKAVLPGGAPQAVVPAAPPAGSNAPVVKQQAAAAPPAAPGEAAGGLKDYVSLVRQGNRLAENGRTKEAQKAFEKALEIDPQGIDAQVGLGYVLLDTEHYQSAVDQFRRALSLGPSGEAIIGLGQAYKARGSNDRALDYYRRYLAEFPNGPQAAMAQRNIHELDVKAPEPMPEKTN